MVPPPPLIIDEPAAIINTVAVQGSPNRLVLNTDGTRLYVASATLPQGITVIDTASFSVLTTIIDVGSPIWLAMHPAEQRLYVSDNSQAGDTPIRVIDTSTDTVIDHIKGFTTVNGMALNSTGVRLYVADHGASEVVVINTANHQRIAATAVGLPREIAIAPGNARSHVASDFDGWTSINLGTNRIVTQTPTVAGEPTTIAHARFNARVYITYRDRGELYIGDTSTTQASTVLGGLLSPYQVAFHTMLEFAYVTETDGDRVSVLNTRTQAITGSIQGFNKPRGIVVAPNGRTAYVANIGNATVSQVRL
ncbi:YVTN family beta-propeller protein [Pseudomonas sp. TE36184]|jgi:YVTN family beta-propeller protein|uniref:YncE family protein n=1 Tax=Pseudomonas TaxID=286 RepID=UPI00061DB319|nr:MULTISPECIES: YncE family protein [Pseudomonas]WKC46004.1 YncE family protein [Pseudomonas veronii]